MFESHINKSSHLLQHWIRNSWIIFLGICHVLPCHVFASLDKWQSFQWTKKIENCRCRAGYQNKQWNIRQQGCSCVGCSNLVFRYTFYTCIFAFVYVERSGYSLLPFTLCTSTYSSSWGKTGQVWKNWVWFNEVFSEKWNSNKLRTSSLCLFADNNETRSIRLSYYRFHCCDILLRAFCFVSGTVLQIIMVYW